MSTKPTTNHVEDAVHDTYAVDENSEQVTVLNTFGQDPNTKPKIPWSAWAILALCALAQMQNVYLGIAPAANAYSIAGALKGTATQRIWIVQAQGVPSIVTGPIFAAFSDVYGRRYVVLFCFLLASIASIVSMTAHGMTQIIIGQTILGVSAGVSGIMFAVASEVLPSNYRAYSQTVVNAVSSCAAVIALIAMGTATSNDPVNGWKWVFRVLLMFSAILFIGFGLLYFPPPRTLAASDTLWSKICGIDWIGYTLLIGGLVPLLIGFAFSSDSNYGWQNAHSYAPIVVGFVFLGICLVYEWKGTSRGFLDHRLFQNGRNFPLALFVIAVEGSLFYLINNIYSSEMNGFWATPGAITTSARLLPFFLVIFAVAPVISIYVTRTKDIKWPLTAGFVCFAICELGLAFSGQNANLATAFNAIGGIGFSAPLILLMTIVQLSTPPLFIGIASALVISVRTLGGVIGYSIAEGIYASLTNTQIGDAIAGAVIPLGFNPQYLGQLIGFLFSGQGLDAIPGVNGQILGAASVALKGVQEHAYKIVWAAFVPGVAIAAIGCAFLENPKERMNWVVDAPLKVEDQSLGEEESGTNEAKSVN